MKKLICMMLAVCLVFALAACSSSKPENTPAPAQASQSAEPEEKGEYTWIAEGYFADEQENFLSITWMDDIDEPGWYVGVMLGEDLIEDSWGGVLPLEGEALKGELTSSGEGDPITVTITETGAAGIRLAVEGGETFVFLPYEMPDASVIVHINTEGWGNIAYAEGEEAPEVDPEYPFQSAQINLAEPAAYTILAWPQAGNVFVKWTKDGEDFSSEPQITVSLDESADFTAVFEEDPGWQNPMMNFIGSYQCGEARALVECFGNEDALIDIEQSESARELVRWTIVGRLDLDTLTIRYSGCTKSIITYDENGEIVSQEPAYEDGTGTVAFGEGLTFTWHEEPAEDGSDRVFEWVEPDLAYIHDPKENPHAMADIIENPEAVYGYSPDPDSVSLGAYAQYDWTDPEFVANAQEERRAYHESMASMMDILYRMREEGASMEEMARAVSEERNRLRLEAYADDPEGLAVLKERNLKTYGHEEGPTPDELLEKYGSWTVVLQKAFSTNMGMDVCCGLYDEYYWLYMELGYVEE